MQGVCAYLANPRTTAERVLLSVTLTEIDDRQRRCLVQRPINTITNMCNYSGFSRFLHGPVVNKLYCPARYFYLPPDLLKFEPWLNRSNRPSERKPIIRRPTFACDIWHDVITVATAAIRCCFDGRLTTTPYESHVENTMDKFAPTTTSEVRTIILKSTNASCDLDPFPTRLLKQCIDDLIVPITAIINLSMREGIVPPDFKQALVTPLIKKKTLCRNEFKNYRPISNLSFLSKILEKIVAKRLNAHIEEHLLSNHVQSAYKRFHSTETALLKIHNDIICNMDNGKVTALTLLDLSAAFDTIDHSTLLERLHVHFGISGTVFQWFKSYISNRQQRVHIDGSLSCPQDLHFGVPQGSVLGPFLFCLYTTSISQMINTHDVSHHMYADDTQVYIELSQSDTHTSISSLSDCLTDISLWMK